MNCSEKKLKTGDVGGRKIYFKSLLKILIAAKYTGNKYFLRALHSVDQGSDVKKKQ